MKKIIFMSLVLLAPLSVGATNIDSINSFAWGENIGWIDFGSEEGNVNVSDTSITGYAYSSNVGWISLDCSNSDGDCENQYGVTNNEEGEVDGYAWGENIGWIDFNGVTIDTNGDFTGYAYSPNVGYISFNCLNTDTCGDGDIDFKVSTSWTKTVTSTTTATTTIDEKPVEDSNSNGSSSRRSGSKKVITRKTAPVGELSLSESIITGPQEDQPTTSYSDENKLSSLDQDLYLGMTHDNVKKLQQLLNKLGYILAESGPGSPGNETNYFGTLTKNALAKFQADNGILPSVGYFGPKTRAVLELKGF